MYGSKFIGNRGANNGCMSKHTPRWALSCVLFCFNFITYYWNHKTFGQSLHIYFQLADPVVLTTFVVVIARNVVG